jgi:hypothetical protein
MSKASESRLFSSVDTAERQVRDMLAEALGTDAGDAIVRIVPEWQARAVVHLDGQSVGAL